MLGFSKLSYSYLLLCIITLLVVTLSGCSKSPDDLYSEGKQLMQEPETFDQAVEVLSTFRERFPDDPRMPEVELALAAGYQSRGLYDQAAERYQYLLDTYPGTAEAYKGMFLFGYMYYENMGDTNRATEVLTKFVKAYPDSELTASAQILIDNMGLPLEEWSVVRDLEGTGR